MDNDNIGHNESVEVILQQLLDDRQVASLQELDCRNLEENQLERLGDAVMEQNHPGQAHVAMDRMMGGEGSASLRQMHINMGSAYLGCNNNSFGPAGGMMGMMGGSYGQNYAFGLITWILVVVFLLLGIIYFWKNIFIKGKK